MERILKVNEIEKLDAYFRALNYLSACELYLKDNPLLKEPLEDFVWVDKHSLINEYSIPSAFSYFIDYFLHLD